MSLWQNNFGLLQRYNSTVKHQSKYFELHMYVVYLIIFISGNFMAGNFLDGDFLAYAVTFGDFMAGNFLAGDFIWVDTLPPYTYRYL